MNKCQGCGVLTDNDLCERCFRIKNYNEYKKVDITSEKFIDILKNISNNDLVILVVDLLNIPESFDDIKKYLKSNIILVLTKYDLIPFNNEYKIIEYFNRYELNTIATVVISSKKNYHLDYLYELIIQNKTSNKVYFIGYTNAGKSSLINKLIYNYTTSKSLITTSFMPNTTVDTISVLLNDFILIDTPGLINKYDIVNYLDFKSLKKLVCKRKIRPISYQIKGKQYINIDKFASLEIENNNIIIYMPENININRLYKKVNNNLHSVSLKIEKTCDLVIPGLGFIKIMKPGNITCNIISGVKIFCRDSII